MRLTLAELAQQLPVELRGDGGICITGVATLRTAGTGQLSFLANQRYRRDLEGTRASAVIVAPGDAARCPTAALVTEDVYPVYARAALLLYPQVPPSPGIHPTATVSGSARLGADVRIEAGCCVGAKAVIGDRVCIGAGSIVSDGVTLGADSRLVAGVTLLPDTRIGARALIQPGAVIGSEGFGLAMTDGGWLKVPQLGGVRIGDDVEIGANTTIDRGALEDTIIEDGVKIDNQVQIAHNVFIGAHTAIAGCVGISGSARIGRYCTLAGGVGVVGHIDIADHVHVTGMSMVTRSISQPGSWSAGTPLMETSRWRRSAVLFRQLEGMHRRLRRLTGRSGDK